MHKNPFLENELLEEMHDVHEDLLEQIASTKKIDEELEDKLEEIITIFTTQFRLME